MSRRSKMLHASLLKCAALGSFLFFSPHATGSDATGTVQFHSCYAPQYFRLDLTRYRGRALDKADVFLIPDLWFLVHEKAEKDWFAVDGMVCAGPLPGVCESVADAKIQILRISAKRVSGNFAVEFQDGQKLKGSFTAKFIWPREEIICE